MARKQLPDGWTWCRLADLGEVNRGRSRHRPRYAEHLYGGPYPFIQTGDVKISQGRITQFQQTYSEAGLAQSRLWPAGTLCITIAANIAETGILTFPACFPDSVVGFISDPEKSDVYFVEYALRSLRRAIQHEASGSVQDNINLGTLDRLHIPTPPLHEQQAIAHILGALDDKIELNRRMNRTLEEIARAIFQSWFVDFDPVRAKAEGRQPTGMDAETAALFPDAFEDSELGPIPAGWKISTLSEITIYLNRGLSPSYTTEGGVLVLNQKCIRDHRIDEAKARRHDDMKKPIVGRFLTVGDIVVNSTGVGTLGRLAPVLSLSQPTVVDSHVTVVRANDTRTNWEYLALTMLHLESEIEALGEGSTGQTELPRVRLGQLRIVVPPKALSARFAGIANGLLSRIATNDSESRTLGVLRDTLLPKLLSGEVRVPEAARALVEAAV